MEDSHQQSTQSGAIIGSNGDLLTEIFLRLPVTSILRFKSVSKHWRFLLSDRHFTHRYDKLSKSPGLFACNTYVPFDVENRSSPLSFRSLDYYFDRGGARILQSCNGLLLCSTDRGPRGGRGALRYYVFNPTTKQLAFIPPIPGGPKVAETICFMGLAFHQTDCVHYKVVCVRSLGPDGNLFQLQIYSSDTRNWKISIQSFSAHEHVFYQGVYWNGAVYWVPFYRDHKFFYFRIDVEQLQPLPLPVGLKFLLVVAMYFGESRGHLHLIVYKKHEVNILNLNVYEMLRDHSGWYVKYQVHLNELMGAFPEINFTHRYGFSVLDVVRGEDEEDTFIVLKVSEKLITYNVHDKSFKQISSLTNHQYHYIESYRYTETLSSF